jgi:hypothetical protein
MRLVLCFVLCSVSALGAPVGLGVGETKHVTVSQRVARVDASDASRVEISHRGQSVSLTGKEQGRTTVHLVTVDGAEVSLDVHVVAPGGRVFTVEKKSPGRTAIARSEKAAEPTKAAPVIPADAQASDAP